MKFLAPWDFTHDGVTFKFLPQGYDRWGGLRIGLTILKEGLLLANGIVDGHDYDRILRLCSAAFYHNGTDPGGHPAEWYADWVMRAVYERAPLEAVAPEGARHLAATPMIDLVKEYPPSTEDYLISLLLEIGGVYLLASAFKTGKTLMLNDLIEAVATGGEFLGRKAKQGKVLLIQLEDSPRSIARRWWKRFIDIDAEMPRNILIDRMPFRLTDANLQDTIDYVRREGIRLVIIDPIINALPPHDYSDPNATREVLEPFRKLAREGGCVVICAAHHRKADGEFGQQISGSHQIGATVDGMIELRRTNTKGERKVEMVGRDWPDWPDEVVSIDPVTLRLIHLGDFQEHDTTRKGKEAEVNADRLFERLSSGSATQKGPILFDLNLSDAKFQAAMKVGIRKGFLSEEVMEVDGKRMKGNAKGYRSVM